MILLRSNVPFGVHIWRAEPGGPIAEAAAVSEEGFEWRGIDGRTPPVDLAELATRPGREVFRVDDQEKSAWGGLLGIPFLEEIVSTPHWSDPSILPAKESGRVARYRRHQSWYRENVLQAGPGAFMSYEALGSYLDDHSVEIDPSLNFLTREAEVHAEERALAVKEEGGALDPVRLRRNLLSSMPLCFNLFGSLRAEPAFLTLFQRVFDATAVRILDVLCEYAPQHPSQFLNDRTAFDAVVFYETVDGPRFMGIETKYTEPFSAREYESSRYDEVTRLSGWFENADSAPATLKGSKSNQLWRNLMLAASLEAAGAKGPGSVAVVAMGDDAGAGKAIGIVREHLADQSRLVWAPIERILDTADGLPELAEWSFAFRLRYVPSKTSGWRDDH